MVPGEGGRKMLVNDKIKKHQVRERERPGNKTRLELDTHTHFTVGRDVWCSWRPRLPAGQSKEVHERIIKGAPRDFHS